MRFALATAALLAATPVWAADDERFCPNRPDLADSGCTVLPGRVLVEVSGVDWQRSVDRSEREDQMVAGDTLVRIGVADHAEVQIGWAPYGRVRTRDKATRAIRVEDGIGDVRLGVRRNLLNPDGTALSVALEPFVVVPVGGRAIGDGDWSSGVAVPLNYALAETWTLNLTAEAAAQADEDRNGRHLSVTGILGVTHDLNDKLSVSGEVSVDREDDSGDRRTETVAAASIAWQPRDRLQLDLLGVAGLSQSAPDLRLVLGGAVLF